MNVYMDMQADYMIQTIEKFKNGLRLAATNDDGEIDKTEQEQIDRICEAADNLIKELKR